MKIVSGIFGGRKLFTPQNRDVRPTSDKIRGAIFNMLQSRGAIDGANVLDAFCGTGALGLEALSRGSDHCTFTDKNRHSLELAQDNVEMLNAGEICTLSIKDATKINARTDQQKPYDLIFLDPPYSKGLVDGSLTALINGDWISPNSWIVCETERSCTIDINNGLILDSEKTYGDTKITLLGYQPITPE